MDQSPGLCIFDPTVALVSGSLLAFMSQRFIENGHEIGANCHQFKNIQI